MKKLILIGLVIVLAACSLVAPSEFESNLQKWEQADISHYRYELFIGCFCIFVENMPLVIEVKDGEVVSMEYANGNAIDENDREFFERFATIDRLFSELEADLAGEADEVTVTYDSTYGFPSQVSIDYIKEAIDDELGLIASNFEVLP
jgi:hypothetical protein